MAKSKVENMQAPKRAATLEDLTTHNINAILEVPDDNGELMEVTLPLRTLSYFAIEKIRASVNDEMPPVTAYGDKVNGIPVPVYNWADPAFIMKRQLTELERSHRVILAAWRQDIIPLPGATDEEKLNYLREQFDTTVIKQIIDLLATMGQRGKAKIAAKADTFLG